MPPTDEAEPGFGPGFSRNVEAVLKIAQNGGFYRESEFRESLRMCGLPLGSDELPALPEFEMPHPPPSDEDPGEMRDDDLNDTGDDPEGDDHA